MALINCPSCKKRISDKAKECSHCHFNLITQTTADGDSAEQAASKQKLKRMKQRYSLQMQAMLGIILFLLGITTWYLMGERGMSKLSHFIELGLMIGGGALYLITRIRLIAFKKSS